MVDPIQLLIVLVGSCVFITCFVGCLGQIICECVIECCYYKCDRWCPSLNRWRHFNTRRRELVKDADLNAECSICQENKVNIITECKHLYHRECLMKWSQECKEMCLPVTCPLCRTPINKAYPVFILDRIV